MNNFDIIINKIQISRMSEITLKFYDFNPQFEENIKKLFKEDQRDLMVKNQSSIKRIKIEIETSKVDELPEFLLQEQNVAYVSPANSQGWMTGGIDNPLAKVILPGIEDKLKKLLKNLNYHGELDQGFPNGFFEKTLDGLQLLVFLDENRKSEAEKNLGLKLNENNYTQYLTKEYFLKYHPRQSPEHYLPVGSSLLIPHISGQWLISAPTMFYPQDVRDTKNAYYAMLAILKVIDQYNAKHMDNPIKKILCCGLCTGVGGMTYQNMTQQLFDGTKDFCNGFQDSPNQLVCKYQNKLDQPETLYLRESALYQSPLKQGMIQHYFESIFGYSPKDSEMTFESYSY